jgi:hypothetical protein
MKLLYNIKKVTSNYSLYSMKKKFNKREEKNFKSKKNKMGNILKGKK